MGNFAERLKQANKRYKSVGDGPDGPPPAVYTFQLQKAEIMEKKDGGLMIIWQHFVLQGAHAGEVATDFSQLTSEHSLCIKNLRQRIARLGYDVPTDLDEYEELVPQIMAARPTYTGRVTHKGGFCNVEIEQLLESKGPANTAASATPAACPTPAQATRQPETVDESSDEPEDGVDVGSTVTFVDEGNVYTGTIDSFDGNDALLNVEGEKDLIAVPLADLTVTSDEDQDAAGEGDDDHFDDLVAIAEGNSIDVPEGADQDSMIELLGGYEWKRAELAEHEAQVLEAVGIPMVEPKPKPKPKAKAKPKAKPKPKPKKKSGVKRKKR